MRIGTIHYTDPVNETGLIEDENEQEIRFFLHSHNLKVNDRVTFEIEMTTYGLAAVNIRKAGIRRIHHTDRSEE